MTITRANVSRPGITRDEEHISSFANTSYWKKRKLELPLEDKIYTLLGENYSFLSTSTFNVEKNVPIINSILNGAIEANIFPLAINDLSYEEGDFPREVGYYIKRKGVFYLKMTTDKKIHSGIYLPSDKICLKKGGKNGELEKLSLENNRSYLLSLFSITNKNI